MWAVVFFGAAVTSSGCRLVTLVQTTTHSTTQELCFDNIQETASTAQHMALLCQAVTCRKACTQCCRSGVALEICLVLMQKECKQCPTCGMAIQRSEGCNKMTCSNCSSHFCYKCGASITGYDHFGEGRCILFDMDEIMRWEAEMAMQQQGAMCVSHSKLPLHVMHCA